MQHRTQQTTILRPQTGHCGLQVQLCKLKAAETLLRTCQNGFQTPEPHPANLHSLQVPKNSNQAPGKEHGWKTMGHPADGESHGGNSSLCLDGSENKTECRREMNFS